MIVDQQALDDHQVRLTVEVEEKALETARRKAARQIAKRVKVPGFRPGKAPYNVIEKQVGAEAIEEEALDIVLDDVYPQVLEESGIKPYGPGTLEKVEEDKDPRVFEFRVPLSPEVELGDYQSVRVPYEEKPVTKKDIDGVIDNLREQQATLQSVERGAEEGDMVYVRLSAERDKADKSGDKALLNERRYPVVVEGKEVDESNEWPFPGFSRLLIGLSSGDEKDFKHSFSEDSDFEDLQGISAIFHVKVEEIKDRILPEFDDEFVKSVGEYKTVKDLHDEVKKTLKDNFKRQQDDKHENEIVEKILEDTKVKFPPQMLDHEIGHYLENLEPQLASQGLDMETYLKSRQMDIDALREEVRPAVEARLNKSLVIMEISRQEKIELSEKEIEELTKERIARLQELLSEDEARKALSGDGLQGLVSSTMTEEVISRTLARLRSIALGEISKEKTEKDEKKKPKASKAKSTKSKASSQKKKKASKKKE